MIAKVKSCPCGALTYTDNGRPRGKCPECHQKAVYRPTEDPDWHHDHVPQGRTRRCARPGCKTTWEILCHTGNRRYCPTCARAVKRVRDRAGKARVRKQAKRNRDVYRAWGLVNQARACKALGEKRPQSPGLNGR
jgi:hypothetical protein